MTTKKETKDQFTDWEKAEQDKTGESPDAGAETPNPDNKSWEEEQQETLFEEGKENIAEIEAIRKKYLKKLTAELEPSKKEKDIKKIDELRGIWKSIDAIFVAMKLSQEKKTSVLLKEKFCRYEISAEIAFGEEIKIQNDLFGEISSTAKLTKNLFKVYLGI
jgi:hypothetical protein